MKIKKILSAVMALTMVMPYMSTNLRTSDIPSAFAESETEAPISGTCGAQGDNLTWTLDSEGTLTISGNGEMKNWVSALPGLGNSDVVKIIIEDGVTTIGNYAFHFCDNLTSITIPDSVTSIGEYAFATCYSLTSVTIPDTVTNIGDCAFSSCYSLTSINVDSRNKYYMSEDDVLFDKEQNVLIMYPTGKTLEKYVIPDSVTSIGKDAFSYCKYLTSVTIPDSVTTIEDYAFSHCKGLTSVKTPDSVTTIRDYAFFNCEDLTSVKISDSVTTIGYSAFDGCTSLNSIKIPESVTSIGEDAFSLCRRLTAVTIENPKCEIHYSEDTISDTATIYGYEGSTAQAYAEKYDRKFVAIDTPTPTPIPTPTTAGDANNDGKVLLNDAILILQHLGNPDAYPLSDQAKANADVCNPGDGITNKDALAIQRYILKVISNLPEYS